MPQFTYEAVDKKNVIHKGQISAENREDAIAVLRETNLYVFTIGRVQESNAFKFRSIKKVKLADLAVMSRQFSTLITSGITVPDTLTILSKQSTNKDLGMALFKIAESVRGGTSLADAFGRYPHIFEPLYVSMLRAGELGGILSDTLERLAEHLEKEKRLRMNIKTATTYPKFVGIFAVVIFFAMMVFLVPTFKSFASNAENVPGLTRLIYAVSDSIRGLWFIWIAVAGGIVYGIRTFTQSKTGHEFWESIKLKLPFLGSFITKTVISRFVRTLGTLLRGGTPIVKALESAGPTSGSLILARVVEAAAREIEVGRKISEPLRASKIFPPMVTEMIAIGEDTGNLPALLDKISEFYDEEIEADSKALSTVLEPILLILVALVVGGMLVALYLPIFSSVLTAS